MKATAAANGQTSLSVMESFWLSVEPLSVEPLSVEPLSVGTGGSTTAQHNNRMIVMKYKIEDSF